MLENYKDNLWEEIKLSKESMQEFKQACYKFYFDKTKKRVAEFFEQTGIEDKKENINGVLVPSLKELFEKINWQEISNGIPVKFHGDFQPENIIVTNDKKFLLLDWREDFGGIKDYGDVYYDFAKLNHALFVNAEIIRRNEFEVENNGEEINYNFSIRSNLLDFRDIFYKFIEENEYDLKKVKTLTALIYLNIAPLHHNPYKLLLFYLGKSLLYELLEDKNEK